MATYSDTVSMSEEFERWREIGNREDVVMLQESGNNDGSVLLELILVGQHEFKLHCPEGYPEHIDNFYVESFNPAISIWANMFNEFLLDCQRPLTLGEVLEKAVNLFKADQKAQKHEEEEMESESDSDEDMCGFDDEELYTTDMELVIARKKKRWIEKEVKLREELCKQIPEKHAGNSETDAIGKGTAQNKQIFTSVAASGILINDLVKIMQMKDEGVTAEPIDDNIYKWLVQLDKFNPESDLAADLEIIHEKFGYGYIELQLDFALDLYPFYPPLVKVVRPRLQPSLMQRVTSMELLKLSHWNPARDMASIVFDIKQLVQIWARLDVNSLRNDPIRYPNGSFVDIEHFLLRLALTSEVNPRANEKYQMDVDQIPRPVEVPEKETDQNKSKNKNECWEKGVGYGHGGRPGWDYNAYLAAQREKDRQIENVLQQILQELRLLYANHAPQLKPRRHVTNPDSSQAIDPVDDMYNILEGSALIPFIEVYMKADSFLEICRHTSVYKALVDIIREIAMQPKLLPLLAQLPGQIHSVYQLLENLERMASVLLQRMCKAGNGSVPKGAKRRYEEEEWATSTSAAASLLPCLQNCSQRQSSGPEYEHSTQEEKLARDFVTLFRDLSDAFKRIGLLNGVEMDESAASMDCDITTTQPDTLPPLPVPDVPQPQIQETTEGLYIQHLKQLQFDTYSMELEGHSKHHFATEFKNQYRMTQAQMCRIVQELTALPSSLPIDLSSSVFFRSDDDKMTLVRALITGPEGTPYSGGCFLFDIYLDRYYPERPPKVNFQTTGNGTVRFNPNLYNNGKVCLSLLGTWEGSAGEKWDHRTSTLLQVLVSIQSLIFVPDPFFNEPGYEHSIGTENGKKASDDYNKDVQINCIKYAMLDQLRHPSPGFEEVIRTHFYYKKEKLLQDIEQWSKMIEKSDYIKNLISTLKQEFNKLKLPIQKPQSSSDT
ncbi:uncharacterized protein LOC141900782 [Tubulanus polymorphus]|uniref:uncharacterized protein LOC141900782 n=1 Tax=Tubulanus polymorphus TaxID=672921 RepID=UPI003DA31E53